MHAEFLTNKGIDKKPKFRFWAIIKFITYCFIVPGYEFQIKLNRYNEYYTIRCCLTTISISLEWLRIIKHNIASQNAIKLIVKYNELI